MAQTHKADRAVIFPLWITAVLDQLDPSEQDAIESALHRLGRSEDRIGLELLADADPDRHNGALYALRVGADLRVLLLRREEMSRYEVVGINRWRAL